MKILKRISYVIVILITLLVQVSAPNQNVDAAAKTLRSMKNELAEKEAAYKKNKEEQAATKNEINNTTKKMNSIAQEKIDIEEEIDRLNEDIKNLNKEIIDMNKEIKDIINFYQLSTTGDSAEIEYFFEAKDFTDFIYRVAVAEQLSKYNKNKIIEYNKKITENEKKKKDLAQKKKDLSAKETELESYVSKQRSLLSKSQDGALSIEQEIAALKKTIDLYQNVYKCKLDETLEQCTAGKIPAGSVLYRPEVSGRVTSNYGKRSYKLNGRWVSDFHYGTDVAGPYKAKVYSSGNGVVAAVFKRSSCGGNMVYINHIIAGVKYCTAYYHLASYTVKVGQVVTPETVIGYQGGSRNEYWDGCSTGSHLHFSVSKGNWGTTYRSYSGFIAKQINPRKVVNFPALGGTFKNKYTKY